MKESLAKNAYDSVQRNVQTARGLELQVFLRITNRLRAALRSGEGGFAPLVAALHENRLLWDAITVDLLHEGNGNPPELKAGLISLGEFVRRQTQGILQGNGSADAIIEINDAIIKGLRGVPELQVARVREV